MSSPFSTEWTWLRDLSTDPLEAALAYHRKGWHPIALSPLKGTQCTCPKGSSCPRPGKHPRQAKWTQPQNEQEIHKSFSPKLKPGVGLLTGFTFWVLDVDGEEGLESLTALTKQHGSLPPTLTVQTGSGGWHYYWKMPSEKRFTLSNRTRFAPGLDTRARGGQVVAPPTLHVQGKAYSYHHLIAISEAPVWLLERITQHSPETALPSPSPLSPLERARLYLQKVDPAISGQGGDERTYKTACSLLNDFALSEEESLTLLLEWNERCQPPWSEQDLLHKIHNAKKYSHGPRGRLLDKPHLRLVSRSSTESSESPLPPHKHKEETTSWTQHLLVTDEGKLKKNVANIIAFLQNHPLWKDIIVYDDFTQKIILQKCSPAHQDVPGGTYPRAWRDEDDIFTASWLQRHSRIEAGIENVARAVIAVSKIQRVHPVRTYLDNLIWDGTPRLDTWLTTYLQTPDTPYSRAVGTKWMLSAIARIYQPGCKADAMLILEGKQGLKKSTSLKTLASEAWFTDELADLGSKDACLQLQGAWIVELSELDGLSRTEVSRVKSFLTRTTDRYRAPYERHVLENPRQCVFAGTVNHATYLRDETGARRFWPVSCEGFAHTEQLTHDRDQLWAEARDRYLRGEIWWIEETSLEEIAKEEQEARYQSDEWEPVIAKFIQLKSSVTIGDILEGPLELEKSRWGQAEQNRVARCLSRLYWKRKKIREGSKLIWKYVPSHA